MYKSLMVLYKAKAANRDALHTLIAFGLMRGFSVRKNWQQIYEKSSEAGAAALRNAVNLYKVQLATPKNSKVVTIPRILQSVPVITYRYHCRLVSLGKTRDYGYNGNLPVRLRWQGSPACLKEDAWTTYREAYLDYVAHCCGVWKVAFDRARTLQFAELQHSNELFPADKRLTTDEAAADIDENGL